MGREKGTLKIGRRMLYEYPLMVLESVCDEILVSASDDISITFPYPTICDEFRGIGPMGGIHSCLRRSAGDLHIVLPYDMPLVNRGLLEYLVEQSPGWEMVVPAMQLNRPEPLCGVYRKSVLGIFEKLIRQKEYAVHRSIPLTRSLVIEIGQEKPFYHPGLFTNINRMEDLDHLPETFGHGV